jgi:hypothetical protein
MKTNYLVLSISISLVLASCKKDEDSKMMKQTYATESTVTDDNGKIDSTITTSMEKDANGNITKNYSFPYIAEDGSRAKATFDDNGKAKTITIEANNRKFVLDFQKATATGELYERNSISAETTPDSLFISQGNNVIHLGKVK